MARLEHFISVGREQLRCGYTTGTCAAAAARASAERLLSGKWPATVELTTPAGIVVHLEPEELESTGEYASCGIRKDGGDDPDITHGNLICAKVWKTDEPAVSVDGGVGVGRVTLPGLDQPVGAAAINSVPRKMILEQLQQVLDDFGEKGGLHAEIFVPNGAALAEKTFNPRLGIVGGISILGTSGIVRPMSEEALIQSLYLEQDALYARGVRHLLLTPGNYGEDFARDTLGLNMKNWALCSNYLGTAIDHAAGLGFASVLLVGHLGKLVKVAGGAMNTHSKTADGRRETMTAHTALCGGDRALCKLVYDSPTTDAALRILHQAGLFADVCASITAALEENLHHRAGNLPMEGIIFSKEFGLLGKTSGADGLLKFHREESI